MLTFSSLIAGSFVLGADIANEIAPLALNSVRFLLAAVLMGVIVAAGPGFKRAYFEAPWRYVIMGALFAFYFVLMFEGLKTATPVSIAAVFTLTPLITAGIAWMVLRQITTFYMAMAVVMEALSLPI